MPNRCSKCGKPGHNRPTCPLWKKPKRPLLSPQAAIAQLIKAACEFEDADWEDPQVASEELIERLGDAVADFRRSIAENDGVPNGGVFAKRWRELQEMIAVYVKKKGATP